jgi:hypothetical protein
LHLDVFERPDHQVFFSNLVEKEGSQGSPCRVKERHLEKEGAGRMVRGAMENVGEKVLTLTPRSGLECSCLIIRFWSI